jgi:hypothetical protein
MLWEVVMKRSISYSLEESLISEITKIAEKQGMTASGLVERVMKEAVDAYQGVESPFDEMTVFQLLDAIQAAKKRKKRRGLIPPK